MHIKLAYSERIFDWTNILLLCLLSLATLYPFVYVLVSSVSDPAELMKSRGLLFWPAGFTVDAYKMVFQNPMILLGYANTLFYVIVGTVLNLLFTSFGAYALSRQNVLWKNPVMFMIIFTMFFSGGLIPSYILISNLGLFDTRWALIFPALISTWNLIVMRTSFQGVPVSLEESARIDGANDFTILFRVVIPLSLPVLAVMILFYGVGHWNAWFGAVIYLRDRELFPLQVILREILIANATDNMMTGTSGGDRVAIGETIKYATIVIATAPILMLYPFLQKYFVKGVMIGALKE
jgi:putative aldouronate transport system permease protein